MLNVIHSATSTLPQSSGQLIESRKETTGMFLLALKLTQVAEFKRATLLELIDGACNMLGEARQEVAAGEPVPVTGMIQNLGLAIDLAAAELMQATFAACKAQEALNDETDDFEGPGHAAAERGS